MSLHCSAIPVKKFPGLVFSWTGRSMQECCVISEDRGIEPVRNNHASSPQVSLCFSRSRRFTRSSVNFERKRDRRNLVRANSQLAAGIRRPYDAHNWSDLTRAGRSLPTRPYQVSRWRGGRFAWARLEAACISGRSCSGQVFGVLYFRAAPVLTHGTVESARNPVPKYQNTIQSTYLPRLPQPPAAPLKRLYRKRRFSDNPYHSAPGRFR